jgi:hypothetical protein
MKKLKSYTQFLTESKKAKELIDTILDYIEPTILEMVNRVEKMHKDEFPDVEWTKFNIKYARLNIISDMVKSIERYTSPSDELLSINTSASAKGNIQIEAMIIRDGAEYMLNTEAIIAGGYNIQRAHYRYITKTKLPKTGNSLLTKEYNAKLKKMSKLERLNRELRSYEKRIADNIKQSEEAARRTDEEIWQIEVENDPKAIWPSWEEIIRRGADKNYNHDEELFNSKELVAKERKITFYKEMNIIGIRSSTIRLKAELVKLTNKINKELESN